MPRATAIVTCGVGGIRWWRKPDIQQVLNLTKTQVERLDIVFEESGRRAMHCGAKSPEWIGSAAHPPARQRRRRHREANERAGRGAARAAQRPADADAIRALQTAHAEQRSALGDSGEPMTRCGRDRRAIPTAES